MKEIVIENKKQLINILKDIKSRADRESSFTISQVSVYEESIKTLIKVLEESK